ncbi:hypothetical protein OTU49_006042 [Cherax quadricarinatus]|uniref:Uncharacterized protein n=1 Tax=Cherax quadricarinatus TaxID=27406 RepID=A0AAW0WPK8_CHEQU
MEEFEELTTHYVAGVSHTTHHHSLLTSTPAADGGEDSTVPNNSSSLGVVYLRAAPWVVPLLAAAATNAAAIVAFEVAALRMWSPAGVRVSACCPWDALSATPLPGAVSAGRAVAVLALRASHRSNSNTSLLRCYTIVGWGVKCSGVCSVTSKVCVPHLLELGCVPASPLPRSASLFRRLGAGEHQHPVAVVPASRGDCYTGP